MRQNEADWGEGYRQRTRSCSRSPKPQFGEKEQNEDFMGDCYKRALAAGQAAYERKDYQSAKEELASALEIRPSFVPLLFRYAQTCQKTGDKDVALDALRRVLFLDPSHRKALGVFSLLSLKSNNEEDKDLVRQVKAMSGSHQRNGVLNFVLQPFRGKAASAEEPPFDLTGMTREEKRLMCGAYRAASLGDYHMALPPLETLHKGNPRDRSVMLAIADSSLAWGAGGRVRERLETLLGKHPEDLALRTRLIRAAAQSERYCLAANLLSGLSLEDRATPDGLLAEATVQYHNEEWEEVLEILSKLEELNDPRPDGVALRALVLAETGRFDEAAPAFEEWGRRAPNSPRLLMLASATGILRKGTSLFDAALSIRNDPNVSQRTRAAAYIALSRAYKADDDRASEFDCLIKANAMMDALYDETAEEAQIEAIQRNVSPAICSTIEKSSRGEGLVFVCGLPRSGSTLVAQILSAHPEAVSIGESMIFSRCLEAAKEKGYPQGIAEFSREDFAGLGQQYIDALPSYTKGARFVIDKELSKYQHMGLLSLMLPAARIVHSRRNPMDVCYSMFCQIFAGWPSAIYRQENLAHLAALHDRITAHWAKSLAVPAYEVHYETMVMDTEKTTRQLLEVLKIPFHENCLDFQNAASSVKTASSYQVRQKVYTASIDAWKRHEEGLRPLRDRLAQLGLSAAG